jgi:hypothetical protein
MSARRRDPPPIHGVVGFLIMRSAPFLSFGKVWESAIFVGARCGLIKRWHKCELSLVRMIHFHFCDTYVLISL